MRSFQYSNEFVAEKRTGIEITLVNKQTGELKEQNPDSIRCSEGVVRFDEFQNEGGDDVLRVFSVRSGRTSDQLVPVVVLEAQREARNNDELEEFLKYAIDEKMSKSFRKKVLMTIRHETSMTTSGNTNDRNKKNTRRVISVTQY